MKREPEVLMRSLDAASAELKTSDTEAARETLEQILATPPQKEAVQPMKTRSDRAFRPRRLVLVPVAAAAVTVGMSMMQSLGGSGVAYASWSPSPSSVDQSELDAVASACENKLQDSSFQREQAKIVLAERRGEYVSLLYRTENPDASGACRAHNVAGTTKVTDVNIGVGGSSGISTKPPANGYLPGMIAELEDSSFVDGALGEEVSAVTIHSGSLAVNATVANGRFAAWWPGDAFSGKQAGPSGKGGPDSILTYDLTLKDGTVIRNAQAALPFSIGNDKGITEHSVGNL